MNDPLIHIGYQRTGTTWLQNFLFRNENGVFWNLEMRKREATDRIVRPNSLVFDAAVVRAHYDEALATMPEGRTPVLSNERLCGATLSGGFDTKEIANRLKEIFPDARVLIGVREQSDMIRSAYNNYIIAGGSASLEDFLSPDMKDGFRLPTFRLQHFSYDIAIAYYRRLFGAERVLVMPHEYLRADPRAYCAHIAAFCGIPTAIDPEASGEVNASLSPLLYPILRPLNPLIQSSSANGYSCWAMERLRDPTLKAARWLDGKMPRKLKQRASSRLSARIRRAIEGVYDRGNQRLQTMTPVDLRGLGYSLPDDHRGPISALSSQGASAPASSRSSTSL
jgi:hypothetical protein